MDNNTTWEQDVAIDVVIPVFRPGKSLVELIRRIKEQTVKVKNIYLLNVIDDSRYDEIQMIDGICNFSYQDGKIVFNGIQTADGDILSFDMDDNLEVKVINMSKSEVQNGISSSIADICESDYILYMMQNVLPLSKNMILNLLEPFNNPDVFMVPAKQTISKDVAFIERFEYESTFGNKGISQINNGFSVIVSALWNYNECTMYKRECLEALADEYVDNISILNEDVVAIDTVIGAGKSIVIADTYVKSVKASNHGYIFSRCLDIKKISKDCNKINIARDFDTFKGLIRMSIGDLFTRGKINLMVKLISYKIAHGIGYLVADISEKKSREFGETILNKVYRWYK